MAHRPGRPRKRHADPWEHFLEREFHVFLEECPAAHAHISYLPLQGYDEPQMWIDEHGVRLFTGGRLHEACARQRLRMQLPMG